MLNRGRTNTASATTRYIKKALAGRIETVKVKSDDYCGGGGTVSGEIEALMSARQILMEAGFEVSEIKTFSAIPSCFFVKPKAKVSQ